MKKYIRYIVAFCATASSVSAKEGDVTIHISKKSNTLVATVEKDQLPVVAIISPVTTGGEKTPAGKYKVMKKEESTFSHDLLKKTGKKWPMTDCLRLENGICLHQGDTSESEGSHGCGRLSRWAAMKLFQLSKVGTEVSVVESFDDGPFVALDAEQKTIWVKSGLFPEVPTPKISQLLRYWNVEGGGNSVAMKPYFGPIPIDVLALVLGKQIVEKGMTGEGRVFSTVNKEVKGYLSGMKKGDKNVLRRYINPKTGVEGFQFDGGDYFLWYSIDEVNDVLKEVGLKPMPLFIKTKK